MAYGLLAAIAALLICNQAAYARDLENSNSQQKIMGRSLKSGCPGGAPIDCGTYCCPNEYTCAGNMQCKKSSCFAANAKAYSCTDKAFKEMKDVKLNEKIMSVTKSGEPTCTTVYHVYEHASSNTDAVVEISFRNASNVLKVSSLHIVYLAKDGYKSDFASGRKAVTARKVKAGDYMFAENEVVVVDSVKVVQGNLVQVLTENSRVIADGMKVSTYSYNEFIYNVYASALYVMYKLSVIPSKQMVTSMDAIWGSFGHSKLVSILNC